MTHSELKEKSVTNKVVKDSYDALEPEFTLLQKRLKARQQAGMSQADIGFFGSITIMAQPNFILNLTQKFRL